MPLFCRPKEVQRHFFEAWQSSRIGFENWNGGRTGAVEEKRTLNSTGLQGCPLVWPRNWISERFTRRAFRTHPQCGTGHARRWIPSARARATEAGSRQRGRLRRGEPRASRRGAVPATTTSASTPAEPETMRGWSGRTRRRIRPGFVAGVVRTFPKAVCTSPSRLSHPR